MIGQLIFKVKLTYIGNVCVVVQHSSRSTVCAGSEYMAILYHTRNQAAPIQHLCSPDILIWS